MLENKVTMSNNHTTKNGNTHPLPKYLKRNLELISGFDMSIVCVHYNSSYPYQFNALAIAQGDHIYLTQGAELCLPHEAWHVVQQKQGRVKATDVSNNINSSPILELEADLMGALVQSPAFLTKFSKYIPGKLIQKPLGNSEPVQCIHLIEKDMGLATHWEVVVAGPDGRWHQFGVVQYNSPDLMGNAQNVNYLTTLMLPNLTHELGVNYIGTMTHTILRGFEFVPNQVGPDTVMDTRPVWRNVPKKRGWNLVQFAAPENNRYRDNLIVYDHFMKLSGNIPFNQQVMNCKHFAVSVWKYFRLKPELDPYDYSQYIDWDKKSPPKTKELDAMNKAIGALKPKANNEQMNEDDTALETDHFDNVDYDDKEFQKQRELEMAQAFDIRENWNSESRGFNLARNVGGSLAAIPLGVITAILHKAPAAISGIYGARANPRSYNEIHRPKSWENQKGTRGGITPGGGTPGGPDLSQQNDDQKSVEVDSHESNQEIADNRLQMHEPDFVRWLKREGLKEHPNNLEMALRRYYDPWLAMPYHPSTQNLTPPYLQRHHKKEFNNNISAAIMSAERQVIVNRNGPRSRLNPYGIQMNPGTRLRLINQSIIKNYPSPKDRPRKKSKLPT